MTRSVMEPTRCLVHLILEALVLGLKLTTYIQIFYIVVINFNFSMLLW